MKKSLLFPCILFLGALISGFSLPYVPPIIRAGANPPPAPITQAERKYAMDYFLQTRQRLLDDIKGLSDAQLNFKANSSRWSIAQCTEHIAVAETFVRQWIQMSLHQPATPEKKSEVKSTTEQGFYHRLYPKYPG